MDTINFSKITSRNWLIFFQNNVILFIFAIFAFIATFFAQLTFWYYIRFLLSQFCFILLPGMTVQTVLRLQYKDKFAYIFASYATGYAISIIIYTLFLFLHIQEFVLILMVPVFLIAGYVLLKNKSKCQTQINNSDGIVLSIMLGGAYILGLVCFQLANLPASVTDGTQYQDLVFWCRNTVAATKSYPLRDLSVYGYNIYYHYFSSLHLAFLYYTTGIEVYNLCFAYSYIINLFLVVGACYLFCNSFLSKKNYIFLTMFLILFTTGLEMKVPISYINHVYWASFGFTEGYAFCLYTFYYFMELEKLGFKDKRYSMLVAVFFANALGLKAPLACVLLVGIGVACITNMSNRKKILYVTINGIMLLMLFFIVYTVFISRPNSLEFNRGLTFSFFDTLSAGNNGSYYNKMLLLRGFFDSGYIPYFIAVLYLYINALPIPFVLNMLSFSKKRTVCKYDFVFISIIFCGFSLWLLLSHRGLSQQYFIFATIPYTILWGMCHLEKKDILFQKNIATFFVGILCIYGVYNTRVALQWPLSKAKSFLTKQRPEILNNGMSLTKDEFYGLRWCSENLPKDAIVATNKVLAAAHGEVSFLTSAFSERQVYLEGCAYSFGGKNTQLIDERRGILVDYFLGGASENLKMKDISYVIIYKNLMWDWTIIANPNIYTLDGNVIFDNNAIIVIKL